MPLDPNRIDWRALAIVLSCFALAIAIEYRVKSRRHKRRENMQRSLRVWKG